MIEIHVEKHKLTVTGHAGAAPKGEDLICAAVSILVHSLDAMLSTYGEDIKTELSEGRYILEGIGTAEAAVAIEMALRGFELLQQHYPEYIKIF